MFSFTEIFNIIWWLVFASTSGNITINPTTVSKLPHILDESSGLLWIDEMLWSLNDSGGRNALYSFNTDGELKDSIVVTNAKNIDWEALAFDRKNRTIYIGDFGNNANKRKDLRIYKIPYSGAGTVTADIIDFHYSDQTEFPARSNFDMEGFFFYEDTLYLFSKNKLGKGSGYSKMYKLPAMPGDHIAELVDSFFTGVPITGATIAPSGKTIVLMSYGKGFLISDFVAPDFIKGKITPFLIPISQTEAVDLISEYEIYFTNEQRRLFYIDLKEHLKNRFFLFELWKNL